MAVAAAAVAARVVAQDSNSVDYTDIGCRGRTLDIAAVVGEVAAAVVAEGNTRHR